MLATKPDPLTGKSPSIVTDDNIQLLFEVQQKVLLISDVVLHAWMIHQLYYFGMIRTFVTTGWWTYRELFRIQGIFDWHLFKASRGWLCHPEYPAGYNQWPLYIQHLCELYTHWVINIRYSFIYQGLIFFMLKCASFERWSSWQRLHGIFQSYFFPVSHYK